MKRVIVTGANGFIGRALTNRLLQSGIAVVAVDVSFNSMPFLDTELLTTVEASVEENLSERIPTDEYDAFYHLAWRGVNGQEKSDPSIQTDNLRMAMDCAKICRKLGVQKLLCAGTVAENAVFSLPLLLNTNGGLLYATAKHACHLLLDSYCKYIGQKYVWMQFSNIYGVGNTTGNLVNYTLQELLSDKDATFGPAQQPYDFIYIDDLIEAVYRIGEADNKKNFYFIGSGTPRYLYEYLHELGRLADKVDHIKIGLRKDDGIRYDFSMFDTTSLRQEIGDYVLTSFEEGIRKTICWKKRQTNE